MEITKLIPFALKRKKKGKKYNGLEPFKFRSLLCKFKQIWEYNVTNLEGFLFK